VSLVLWMAESEDVKDVEEDVRQLLNIFDLWCPVNKEEKVGPDLPRSGLPLIRASLCVPLPPQRAARKRSKDMSEVQSHVAIMVDSFWDKLSCLKVGLRLCCCLLAALLMVLADVQNWAVMVELLFESQKAKRVSPR
jgi:hypothetical protein